MLRLFVQFVHEVYQASPINRRQRGQRLAQKIQAREIWSGTEKFA
jgi:hypothetical protein